METKIIYFNTVIPTLTFIAFLIVIFTSNKNPSPIFNVLLDGCELVNTTYAYQPVSSISNIGFLVAAVSVVVCCKDKTRWGGVYACLLIIVGASGALVHAFQYQWMSILHEDSTLAFLSLLIALHSKHIFSTWLIQCVVYICFSNLFRLTQVEQPDGTYFLVMPILVPLQVAITIVYFAAEVPYYLWKDRRGELLYCAALVALMTAIMFRVVSSDVDDIMCKRNNQSLVQGHAFFHLFAASIAYFMFEFHFIRRFDIQPTVPLAEVEIGPVSV